MDSEYYLKIVLFLFCLISCIFLAVAAVKAKSHELRQAFLTYLVPAGVALAMTLASFFGPSG